MFENLCGIIKIRSLKMPCCCATNVKAAFVLGIILVIFSLLSCFGTDEEGGYNIISGIVFALINGILVYGAHARNSTAILVWMILAIIECVFYAIIAVIVIIAVIAYAEATLKIFLVVI